jgi:hypothetical protein
MPTDEDYEQIKTMVQNVRSLERKRARILPGNKTLVRNPMTDADVEISVSAGIVDDLDSQIAAAKTALKQKFGQMFP